MRNKFHLILLTVMLFTSLVWIPDVQASTRPEQNGPTALVVQATRTLNVQIVDNMIGIRGTGYAKNRRYLVIARTNNTRRWTFLGGARSKPTGKIKGEYLLPRYMVDFPSIRVCVVDTVNRGETCKLIIRR